MTCRYSMPSIRIDKRPLCSLTEPPSVCGFLPEDIENCGIRYYAIKRAVKPSAFCNGKEEVEK